MANPSRFPVKFSGLDWVPNFEKARWFLVLRLEETDNNRLNELLHISNEVVQQYGQMPLYAPAAQTTSAGKSARATIPSKITLHARRASGSNKFKTDWSKVQDVSGAFHISIAWTLHPPTEQLLEITKAVADQSSDVYQIQVRVEEVKAKGGNVVTNIPLPQNIREGKGLFG